jgi:hypothetical protein
MTPTSEKKIANRWWVQPLLTFIIVGGGVAATYGSLQNQVSTINRQGSEPVQDLQTRVAVLESAFKRYDDQNTKAHETIESKLDKLIDYHMPVKP